MAQTNETSQNWTSTQAYVLAVICLLVGGAIGYLLRGSTGTQTATTETPAAQQQGAAPPMGGMGGPGGGQMPTREQLKAMADKQAAPLIEKLKATPNDAVLLAQVGNMYYDAQVFGTAIEYYTKSLAADPKNDNVRTDLATSYFSSNEPDKAIAELDKVVKNDPKNINALFNRGIVKWQGKMDVDGAVADWETLLKSNPNFEGKDKVQMYIAQAKKHSNIKPGQKSAMPVN